MESCTRFAISSCLSNFPLFFFSTIFIIIFIFSNKEKVSWSRRVTSRIAPINQPHHLFCFVKKNHDSKIHRDLEKTFANVDFGEGVPNRPSDIHDYSVFGIFWKCARIGERLSPYVSLCCVAMAVRGVFFFLIDLGSTSYSSHLVFSYLHSHLIFLPRSPILFSAKPNTRKPVASIADAIVFTLLTQLALVATLGGGLHRPMREATKKAMKKPSSFQSIT